MLARLHGQAVIEHSLDCLLEQSVGPIVVVTGSKRRRVERLIRSSRYKRRRVRLVNNPAYRSGMASSLRCGLAALPQACHGALICLGDMPDIEPRLVLRLRDAWHAGLDYVRPVSQRLPGHPVLVSRQLFPAMAALEGDGGAKAVLDGVPRDRYRLVAARDTSLRDIDTPAALRRAANARRPPTGRRSTTNQTQTRDQRYTALRSFMV